MRGGYCFTNAVLTRFLFRRLVYFYGNLRHACNFRCASEIVGLVPGPVVFLLPDRLASVTISADGREIGRIGLHPTIHFDRDDMVDRLCRCQLAHYFAVLAQVVVPLEDLLTQMTPLH